MNVELDTVDLLVRLGCAVLFGALVGLERDTVARSAGARTHALVALGSALFTIVGAYGFTDIGRESVADPARIAAQVATGVGFIGAGAIIRHGSSVRGITTAATIWLSAALGVTAGAGAVVAALIATVATLVVLIVLRLARPYARRLRRHELALEIIYERGYGTLGPLIRLVHRLGATLDQLIVDDDGDDDDDVASAGLRRVTMYVSAPKDRSLDELVEAAGERPEVRVVRTGEQST